MTKITRTCKAQDFKVLTVNIDARSVDEMEVTVIEPNTKNIEEQLSEVVGLKTNGYHEFCRILNSGEIYPVKLTLDLAAALSAGTIEKIKEDE